MQAARIAVKQAKEKGMGSVTVVTDSQFLINGISCQYQHYYHVTAQFDRYRTDKTVYNLLIFSGITSWIHKWKKNGWTLSDNTKVKNEEDWKSLDSEMQGIDVKFVRILVSTVSSVKSVEYLIKNS